mgnify:FL=1|jgi:hypothetical protein
MLSRHLRLRDWGKASKRRGTRMTCKKETRRRTDGSVDHPLKKRDQRRKSPSNAPLVEANMMVESLVLSLVVANKEGNRITYQKSVKSEAFLLLLSLCVFCAFSHPFYYFFIIFNTNNDNEMNNTNNKLKEVFSLQPCESTYFFLPRTQTTHRGRG